VLSRLRVMRADGPCDWRSGQGPLHILFTG
jgi:hypothetical protein